MDLSTAIEQFFGDVQTAAQTIAPLIAVIGFIGLGVMYMGSSWPIIGDWKKDNPKAANQVVVVCSSSSLRPVSPHSLPLPDFTISFGREVVVAPAIFSTCRRQHGCRFQIPYPTA